VTHLTGGTPLPPIHHPVAGWLVWALGWIVCAILLIAVVALTTGPIAYWTQELAPPPSGGLTDNVIPAAISGALIAGLGTLVFSFTRIVRAVGVRLRTRRAEQMLARDPRPPVLYLRSFQEDERLSGTSESFELSLASVLRDVGPVIAVGRPGERLPPQGAARVYVSDESWQPTVRDLMARSAVTILRAGTSRGVLWELARVVEVVSPTRFLIAVPAELRSRDAQAWTRFCALANDVMPRPLPPGVNGATFVAFDSEWNPSVLTSPKRVNPLSTRANVRSLLRPFCARSGFRLRRRSLSDIPLETMLAFALMAQAGVLSRLPSELYWRELATPEGVTISMPGKPSEKRTTADIRPGVQLHTHEYGVLRRDRSLEFSMSVTDYTNLDFTQNPEGAFEGARDAMVNELRGTLVRERPVQMGPNAGREWQIDVAERRALVRTRVFLVGPRRTLMALVVMPANGSEDEAGRRFLDSLQLR
jgi:hypothetical protein